MNEWAKSRICFIWQISLVDCSDGEVSNFLVLLAYVDVMGDFLVLWAYVEIIGDFLVSLAYAIFLKLLKFAQLIKWENNN